VSPVLSCGQIRLGRVPAAGRTPKPSFYNSASSRVFTLNGDAHSSTVIDGGRDADREHSTRGHTGIRTSAGAGLWSECQLLPMTGGGDRYRDNRVHFGEVSASDSVRQMALIGQRLPG
jgi:hypothetical protein